MYIRVIKYLGKCMQKTAEIDTEKGCEWRADTQTEFFFEFVMIYNRYLTILIDKDNIADIP